MWEICVFLMQQLESVLLPLTLVAELFDREKPHFQRVHVDHSNKLNLLLLHRLLHHEVVGAAQVVQTLAGFYHNNPGAVRKVAYSSLYCIRVEDAEQQQIPYKCTLSN